MAKQYITLKQAAQKWKSKPWYIQKACDAGQIPEAVKLNEEWIIPADLERPHMYIENKHESKEPEYQHGDAYKDHIYRMTMSGFPNFNVRVYEIGGATYEVYSCFSADATQTATEKLYGYAMRKAADDCKKFGHPFLSAKSQREVLDQIRENELESMPSSEELRNYYYNGFVKIGFTETEIAELMAKINEHIAKRNKNFGVE